jgi:hypothetical protein
MTLAASRPTLNAFRGRLAPAYGAASPRRTGSDPSVASLRDATSGSDPNFAPLLISRVYEEELTR